MASRCAQGRCTKLPVLGSRCVRHWMRKQQAYKELPTHSKWWPEFEAGLIAGIEIRVSMGEAAPPPCIVMPKSQLSKWEPKVLKLIASADALWRKRDQSGSGSEAP